jgi:hypothetical protein
LILSFPLIFNRIIGIIEFKPLRRPSCIYPRQPQPKAKGVSYKTEESRMVEKPTYKELEQRIRELEEGFLRYEQAEEELLYRADMETMVSEISTSFIHVPSEKMDHAIQAALRRIGEFAGVDRAYLFLFHEDGL